MNSGRSLCASLLLVTAGLSSFPAAASAPAPLRTLAHVEVTSDSRLLVNGTPFFMIGLMPGPPLGLKTPEGGHGWAELAEDGVNVVRDVVPLDLATPGLLDERRQYLDEAASRGIYVWPNLRELAVTTSSRARARLTEAVHVLKSHPAVLMWLSIDEPEWGKKAPESLRETYRILRNLDPHHPVWINQAPRGTMESLLRYRDACDAVSIDIYPVSEPPGKHARRENTGLSLVGDFTSETVALAGEAKFPFMVLQATWSGVLPTQNPKNRLMYPSFRELRFMMYESLIAGANGVSFFGYTFGNVGDDYDLGWNWFYWRAVMKPLLAEIKAGTELSRVLTLPDTTFPLVWNGAPQIEVRTKVAGPFVYIFAAAREGEARAVTFSSSAFRTGEFPVLHEHRSLETTGTGFTDSFRPYDVHVYRVPRFIENSEVRKTREQIEKDRAKAALGRVPTAHAGAAEYFVPEGADDTTAPHQLRALEP